MYLSSISWHYPFNKEIHQYYYDEIAALPTTLCQPEKYLLLHVLENSQCQLEKG